MVVVRVATAAARVTTVARVVSILNFLSYYSHICRLFRWILSFKPTSAVSHNSSTTTECNNHLRAYTVIFVQICPSFFCVHDSPVFH